MNTPFIICRNEEWFSSLALQVKDLQCKNPDIAMFVHDETVFVTIFRNNITFDHREQHAVDSEIRFHIDSFPEGTWQVAVFGAQNGYLTEVTYAPEMAEIPTHTPEPSTTILFGLGLILCAIGRKMQKSWYSS